MLKRLEVIADTQKYLINIITNTVSIKHGNHFLIKQYFASDARRIKRISNFFAWRQERI